MKMESEIKMKGKWQFVGAESLVDSEWRQSTSYVEGMTWEFLPLFFGESKTIGGIVEISPESNPIEMAYMYNRGEQLLTIDTSVDSSIDLHDDDEVDIYDVIPPYNENPDDMTIRLSIRTQRGCSVPQFRYILRKME